jgi:arabinogalactan oligomer/maltooligosaccharide transport system substrate-binding protein
MSTVAACSSSSVPSNSDKPKDSNSGGTTEVTDVTLTLWLSSNEIETGSAAGMITEFKAAHPEWNLTVNIAAVGEDVAKDEVLKDVAAAADVYTFANDQIEELKNAGAIARIGGSYEALVKSEQPETVVKTGQSLSDGNLYGIPFSHNTFFMFYDKTLLTENDVKSVEGIVGKSTAADVYNFCFDAAGGWKLGAWYYGQETQFSEPIRKPQRMGATGTMLPVSQSPITSSTCLPIQKLGMPTISM